MRMGKRAVFLDRDGTLIEQYDYLAQPEQVKLLPTTVSALRLLRDRGFSLVMVTNQSAVARGMLAEKKLQEIHRHLQRLLAREGTYLDGMYYCPYHPEGIVENYRRESELRKPGAGMLELAARELDLNLAQSWMVGDDDRDILAGQAAGCRTILLIGRGSDLVQQGRAKPDFQALNLQEAANLIVRYAGQEPIALKDHETITAENKERDTPVSRQIPPSEIVQQDTTVKDHAQPDLPEEVELQPEKAPSELKEQKPQRDKPTGETDLLQQMLRELRNLNRQQRFKEFSVLKLLAGMVQMVVILCLIFAVFIGTGLEERNETVHTCLLLALVFQVMVLSLLVMHKS